MSQNDSSRSSQSMPRWMQAQEEANASGQTQKLNLGRVRERLTDEPPAERRSQKPAPDASRARAQRPRSAGQTDTRRAAETPAEGASRTTGGARRRRDDSAQPARRPARAHAQQDAGAAPRKATAHAKEATDAQQPRRRTRTKADRAQMRTVGSYRRIGVMSTGVIMALGAFVGLLFFARPSTSAVERRNLAAFPQISWQTFWNGSFFSDVALWYSDTYPLREPLVRTAQAMNGLHGIQTKTQMVGGTKKADELPPAEKKEESTEATTTETTEKKKREPVEVPAAEVMAEAVQDQITNGLYVKEDAAYTIYYFSQEAVQEYADAINMAQEELAGQTEVYSVVVPNSSGIMLSDQEVKDLGGTNQVDAIEYFYSLYNDNVHSVDTVSELQKHTNEYIFYRTDHHWTSLGAYYGYVAFCQEKGITPEDRSTMQHVDYGDFLGSYYSELGSAAMQAHPDTVEAWIPNGTNSMTLYDIDGTVSELNVITDTSDWDITGKTMAFIMGDQPLEKIENPKVTDGSSCLVIKDSFGDFFVPWLVDHYQTVWVGDFRYFEGNIREFCQENGVKDLIILNNVSLAGGGVVGPAIMGRL